MHLVYSKRLDLGLCFSAYLFLNVGLFLCKKTHGEKMEVAWIVGEGNGTSYLFILLQLECVRKLTIFLESLKKSH